MVNTDSMNPEGPAITSIQSMAMSAICGLSPWGRIGSGGQVLSILIYHRVLDEPDFMRPGEPDVLRFSMQMEILARYFNPIGMADALARLEEGTLPPRAVCVSFDDGYADNFHNALPILSRWQVPATVFIATGFLNGGRMWNDTIIEAFRRIESKMLDLSALELGQYSLASASERRLSAVRLLQEIKHLAPEKRLELADQIGRRAGELPNDLMLTTKELRDLSDSGVEIGGHTQHHPILASLSLDAAKSEILAGKNELEALLQKPVRYFAYPNGRPMQDFLPEHRDCLEGLGFEAALTTQKGVAVSETDRYMIPRFTPWDRNPLKFAARMLANARDYR